MKFRKLPKEKRNHLILVVIGTLAVLNALGFGLIKKQYDGLGQVAMKQESARAKLKEMEEAVKREELVDSVCKQASQLLQEKESSMATDDLYYKQATMQIGGTAYYHDLGQFIADFENEFPLTRVANLTIEFAQGAQGDREKLAFKMDLITLIKASQP